MTTERCRSPELPHGRTWARLLLVAVVWCLASLPFLGLYLAGRRSVMEEIRSHARSVAATAANDWDMVLLDRALAEGATPGPAYRQVQLRLDRIRGSNPDVRYVYIMRRPREPLAAATAMEYLADASPLDLDRNGRIDRAEESEAPGTAYDASDLPAMVQGWLEPTADAELSPDPPYPDVLSGYAPIRDGHGQVRALLGVDIVAATVSAKLRRLTLTALAAWLLTVTLITLLVHVFLCQRDTLAQVRRLNEDLAERNELLRAAGRIMAQEAESSTRERRLALAFQSGLVRLPVRPPPRKLFEKPYLVAQAVGPDLAEVFDLDANQVGFCFIGAAGEGGRLGVHLLRTALFALRQRGKDSGGGSVPLTDSARVAGWLNELVIRELGPGQRVNLVYGAIDVSSDQVQLACAGGARVLVRRRTESTGAPIVIPAGPPIGHAADTSYTPAVLRLAQGDRLLVVGQDALPSPLLDALQAALAAHGAEPPDLLAQSLVSCLPPAESEGGPEASFLLLHLR